MVHNGKRMKRMAVGVLGFTLLIGALQPLSPLWANERDDGLTLEEAWSYAQENNAELRMVEEQLELAEARAKDAQEDLRYAKNRMSSEPQQQVTFRKQEFTVPLSTEADVYDLTERKEELLLEVRLQLESTLSRLTVIETQRESLFEEQGLAEERLAAQRKRTETGQDIPSSIGPYELELLQLEQRLTELNGQRELLLLDAAEALGMERKLLRKLERRPVPDITEYALPDIEELAERLSASHVSVVLAEKRSVIAAKDYEIIQKAYQFNNPDHLNAIKDAEDQAFVARLALRDAKLEAERKVRSDAQSIQNLADGVAIAQLNAELAEKQAEMDEKRRELGMITNMELQQSKMQAESAVTALAQAKIDLYAAVERFEFYIANVEQ